MGIEYKTGLVRFCTLNIFEMSKVHKDNDKLYYNCIITFSKKEKERMDIAIEEAIQEGIKTLPAWKKRRPPVLSLPIKEVDDETRERWPHNLDYWIKLKSTFEVAALDKDKNIITPENRDIIYPGMWGRANFTFKAYQSAGAGVTTYLFAVQKLKDDAKLGKDIRNCFDDDFDLAELEKEFNDLI